MRGGPAAPARMEGQSLALEDRRFATEMIAREPARHALYCITFPNGKRYIGMTHNIERRRRGHIRGAAMRRLPVEKAISKYGAKNVRFDVLVVGGSREYIAALEIAAIAAYRTKDRRHGYNVLSGGDGFAAGHEVSEATRTRLSAAHRGRKASAAARANMSASHKGKPKTDEWRRRIAESNRGLKRSEETRARIAVAVRGRKFSPEARARMSAAHIGRPLSETHKKKIADGKARANA